MTNKQQAACIDKLPMLPPVLIEPGKAYGYTAHDMQAYAIAALEAARLPVGDAEPVAWLPAAMLDPKRAEDFFTAGRFKVASDSVPVYLKPPVAGDAVRGLVASIESLEKTAVDWRVKYCADTRYGLSDYQCGQHDAADEMMDSLDERLAMLKEQVRRALAVTATPAGQDADVLFPTIQMGGPTERTPQRGGEFCGWSIDRVPDPPFPNDLMQLTSPAGDTQFFEKKDAAHVWRFLAALQPNTTGEV